MGHLSTDMGSHNHKALRDESGHRLPDGNWANLVTTSEFVYVEVVARAVLQAENALP